jgi:hypothetical protein
MNVWLDLNSLSGKTSITVEIAIVYNSRAGNLASMGMEILIKIWKQLVAIGLIALFFILLLVGNILFSSTWIPSQLFWIGEIGIIIVAIILFMTARLDSAYQEVTRLELEAGALEDEEEAVTPALDQTVVAKSVPAKKKPVPRSKPAAQLAANLAPKQPAKPVARMVAEPAAEQEPEPAAEAVTEEEFPAIIPTEQLAIPEVTEQAPRVEPAGPPKAPTPAAQGKNVKANDKLVRQQIAKYAGEGIIAFSLNKIKNELGITDEKQIEKLRKILLIECGRDVLYKKGGTKYYIVSNLE